MEAENLNSLKGMVPKKYKHRHLIACEISSVISQHKCLKPVMDHFVFNDGSCKYLMCLTGKIPVFCDGIEYNYPVCLWLLDTYPLHPPMCYLKPTKGMMTVRSEYVDTDGKINFPYLQEWKPPLLDLCGLVDVMKATFSEELLLCPREQSMMGHESLSREYLSVSGAQTQTEMHSSLNGRSLRKEDVDLCHPNESIC